MNAIKTGLWWVFWTFGVGCLLASLVVGHTAFTQLLLLVAFAAFVPASLLELGSRS